MIKGGKNYSSLNYYMLNRRYVRIKVLQTLYAYAQDSNQDLAAYRKFYTQSLDKLRQAYLKILSFPSDLFHFASLEMETQNAKYIITPLEIDKLNAILQNKPIQVLANDAQLDKLFKANGSSWQNDFDKFRKLYTELLKASFYRKYLALANPTHKDQVDFLDALYKSLLNKSEVFDGILDEQFIGWADDKPVVMSNLARTIPSFKEDGTYTLLSDIDADWDEIKTFGAELMNKTLQNSEEYDLIVTSKTPNWDPERIALTDRIMLKMAVCEFINFNSIPVKVTINEYLEISKIYSTPKSSQFLNGVLDNLQKELKASGRLEKSGRGLVG
jgi:N utilization substance protein B